MSSQNWMDHFKDRIKGLAPNSAKPGQSLLWTAIKKNMIRSHEYMTWVQQNLQAVTLRSDFFLSVPITPQVYKKWHSKFAWSPECLPLYEWDNVLYVGCLEKPKNFNLSARCVFIYCPVEGLETGWNQWQSLARSANKLSPQEINHLAEKDPMAALEKTMVMSGQLSDEFMAQLEAGQEQKDDEATPTEGILEENEAPEGISLNLKSSPHQNVAVRTQTANTNISRGSAPSLDRTNIIEHTSTVIPLPPKRKKSTDSLSDTTTTSFGKTSILDKTRIIEQTSASIPLPPKKKSSTGSAATTTKPIKKRSFNISPGASFQPSVFDILGNLQADKVKNSVSQVFNEMKNHFSKSMILKINGDSFTPWKWDEGFASKPDNLQPLPLQTPSIFRVPWRTRKPYHGYIVPNDVNEAFFDEWNQTRIPDHVTIVPIIVHDNVTGLLLGIANKPVNTEQSLSTAEKLANKLVNELLGA